jgi:hypothetical protein
MNPWIISIQNGSDVYQPHPLAQCKTLSFVRTIKRSVVLLWLLEYKKIKKGEREMRIRPSSHITRGFSGPTAAGGSL